MEININEAFAGEDIGVDEKVSVRHGFAPQHLNREGTEKHTIFILILIKREKSIRVFMILVDFLLGEI